MELAPVILSALAFGAAAGALYNTGVMIRDLSIIKAKLGIEKKQSQRIGIMINTLGLS